MLFTHSAMSLLFDYDMGSVLASQLGHSFVVLPHHMRNKVLISSHENFLEETPILHK